MAGEPLRSRCGGFSPELSLVVRFQEPARANDRRSQSEHSANGYSGEGEHRGQIGFSPQQVREEALKARLILARTDWRGLIDRAEEHGYFSGQIEFLLDFCGVLAQTEKMPTKWDGTVHAKLQTAFDGYFTKAQICFASSGLAATRHHLWKRALLTVGDYLSSS